MQNLFPTERTHIIDRQGFHSHCCARARHELHLYGFAITVDMHNGSYITAFKAALREVSG